MAKESWRIVVFAVGILHCVGVSCNPEHVSNPEEVLTALVSPETKTPQFPNAALAAEERQGYYHSPHSEGGFLDFITNSAKFIGSIFSDSSARYRQFSDDSSDDRDYRIGYSVQSFYPTQKFRSFSHASPPPPRSERSSHPFHRPPHHPPPRRHPDFRKDQSHKNSGHWTGSYSSHFKLFDVDSEDVADTLHHPQNNLIDRRHTSTESFSINHSNEFRANAVDKERLSRFLESEAYKLRFPLETIDTRSKNYPSAESLSSLGSFLWPEYEESSEKQGRQIENVHDYENTQFRGPTSFQHFQRGSLFDTVEISDAEKWEQWGKLVGKSSSTKNRQDSSAGTSQQNSKPSGRYHGFKSSVNANIFSRTKNRDKSTPSHSFSIFPEAREQKDSASHLKHDSFSPTISHNSFSSILERQDVRVANNFQNAFTATTDNHKNFGITELKNSNIGIADYQDSFTANDMQKSFPASELQSFFLTPSTAVPTSDKKHSVGNVVDALKIVVDALEKTPSQEKIYIKKTSPRPPTSINFKFSPRDTLSGNSGSEWTPLF